MQSCEIQQVIDNNQCNALNIDIFNGKFKFLACDLYKYKQSALIEKLDGYANDHKRKITKFIDDKGRVCYIFQLSMLESWEGIIHRSRVCIHNGFGDLPSNVAGFMYMGPKLFFNGSVIDASNKGVFLDKLDQLIKGKVVSVVKSTNVFRYVPWSKRTYKLKVVNKTTVYSK